MKSKNKAKQSKAKQSKSVHHRDTETQRKAKQKQINRDEGDKGDRIKNKMCPLSDNPMEWLEQAEHDIGAAEHMAKSKQRFYALFFCHLSVEKALKGLYFQRIGICAPKTHNLPYLLEKINERPPEDIFKFIMRINEIHIVTRYPEDIVQVQKEFSSEFISFAITNSKETIKWIKNKF